MMNPLHKCNIQCHTIDPIALESMGLTADNDKGKWLPFCFLLDVVIAYKMTTDELDELAYNCTSVFTEHGDTYVIDTPFKEFDKKFTEWIDELSPTKPSSVNL